MVVVASVVAVVVAASVLLWLGWGCGFTGAQPPAPNLHDPRALVVLRPPTGFSFPRTDFSCPRTVFSCPRTVFFSPWTLNPSFAPVNPSFAPKNPPQTRPGRPVFCPADLFFSPREPGKNNSTDRGPGGREDTGGAARQGAREGVGAGAAATAAGHSRAPCLLLSPFPSPSLFPRRLAVPPTLHAPTAFPVLVFLTYR